MRLGLRFSFYGSMACQPPTADCKLLTAHHHLPTANRQLSTANRQAPTTNFQTPTTNHQPPTANHQPPTINFQPPTADHQHSTVYRRPPNANRQPTTFYRQLVQRPTANRLPEFDKFKFKLGPLPPPRVVLANHKTTSNWYPVDHHMCVDFVNGPMMKDYDDRPPFSGQANL